MAVAMQNNSQQKEAAMVDSMDKIVVRFEYDGTISWLYKRASQIQRGKTSVAEIDTILNEVSAETDMIVLLKGLDVEVSQVTLPDSVPQDQIFNLVRFKIEEDLFDDISAIRFFILHQEKGTVTVAIISTSFFSEVKNIFKNININKIKFLPDFLVIPLQNDSWTICMDGAYALIRSHTFCGLVWEAKLLDKILATLIKDANQTRIAITLYGDIPEEILQEIYQLKIDVTKKSSLDLLDYVYETENTEVNIKLYTESTRGNLYEKISISSLKKYLIYGFSILLMLTLVLQITKLFYLDIILKRVSVDKNQLLTSLYPKGYKDNRLLEKTKQEVAEFNRNGNNAFFQLFLLTGNVLKDINQKDIVLVSYDERKLTLNIRFNNFSELAAFKEKLSAVGLNVEQMKADSTPGEVVAELAVTSG